MNVNKSQIREREWETPYKRWVGKNKDILFCQGNHHVQHGSGNHCSRLKVQMPNENKSPMQQTTTWYLFPALYSTEWKESMTLVGTLRMLQWPGGKEFSGCQSGVLTTLTLPLAVSISLREAVSVSWFPWGMWGTSSRDLECEQVEPHQSGPRLVR